jgi:hypothetical protein
MEDVNAFDTHSALEMALEFDVVAASCLEVTEDDARTVAKELKKAQTGLCGAFGNLCA